MIFDTSQQNNRFGISIGNAPQSTGKYEIK